jgi:hypothetical protein
VVRRFDVSSACVSAYSIIRSSTGVSGNASTEDAHIPTSSSVSGSSTSVNTTTSERDGWGGVGGGVRFVFRPFVLRVADTRA